MIEAIEPAIELQNHTSRKLASIQVIESLEPIDGADAIELARVLSWNLVVKKGEFNVGGKCVYIEVDSLVPTDRQEFEFLKKIAGSDGMARIKTIRLRGQISQGLALPLSQFSFGELEVGEDVTSLLDIKKYDPEIQEERSMKAKLGGRARQWPEFLQKTDEIRVQTLKWLVEKYKGELFYVTEKLDGSSFTCYYKNGKFGICSRNMEIDRDETNAFWKTAIKMDIERKLTEYCQRENRNIALQGELIGPGVQGNKYQLSALEIRLFNVYDIDKGCYLDYDIGLVGIVTGNLQLPTVPFIHYVTRLPETVDEIIEMSKMNSTLNPNMPAEGIVFRPINEKWERKMGRVTFKAINPNFELKYSK